MKKSARQRVFEALALAGQHGCTTGQLCQPGVGGVRFGARVKELRDEGHRITATLVRPGSHRYVLEPVATTAPAEQAPSEAEEFGQLFELAPRRTSAYDPDAAA